MRDSRGLVDVKPREQIICNTRFEWEIKSVRLWLNSNSQYFAIFNQIAEQRAKALLTAGNCYNSSLWREGFE